MSNIEWTDTTWNPVIGCSRVSEGCRNCYAETMASRLSAMGQEPYQGLTMGTGRKAKWTGVVRFMPDRQALPLRWRKPRRIFVNSMSDLFHPGVTFEQVAAIFAVMTACPQHTFQVLTKRPERAVQFFTWFRGRQHPREGWAWVPSMDGGDLVMDRWQRLADAPLPNVHLGVSVENQATADERIPLLLWCPAAVRWVSAEPLLGAVDLRNESMADGQDHDWLTGLRYGREDDGSPFGLPDGARINWVVAGGESGHGARPLHPDWVRSLRDQCMDAGVAFLFKQWGAWGDFTGRMPEAGDSLVNVILPSGRLVGGGGGRHGSVSEEGDSPDAAWMVRVGKAKAGRLLDGRLWDEYPEQE